MTVLEQQFMERVPHILRDIVQAIENQNAVISALNEKLDQLIKKESE